MMRNRALSRCLVVLAVSFTFVSIPMIQPMLVHAQSDPLPKVVVTEGPPAVIPMQRSDFSISGFESSPLTFEVQVQDNVGTPVADDYFGPYTYFEVDARLTDARGDVVTGAIDSIPTQNGIARFEGVVLRVTPGTYELIFTVRIVFAVASLGSTSLTLDTTTGGTLMIGIEPTPIPSATPTVNPYAGTPPAILTYMAMLQGVSTALAKTPEPTAYCPPTDLFNCQYPTSTPTPTGTATPTPTITLAPVVSPIDDDYTVTLDARGGSFQNEVSGPSGDTVDIIDFVFSIGSITQTTTYTLTFTCPDNSNAAAMVVAFGTAIACGRGGSVTVDTVNNVVRVAVTSLSAREQIRTPYGISIVPPR